MSITSDKRKYARRSEEERINELEERINQLKNRIESKKRKDSPVLSEIPRLQKKLRKFAQLAMDHGRHDVANSTTAFVAGLDRIANPDQETLVDWVPSDDEDDDA